MIHNAGINEKVVKQFETEKEPTLNIGESQLCTMLVLLFIHTLLGVNLPLRVSVRFMLNAL